MKWIWGMVRKTYGLMWLIAIVAVVAAIPLINLLAFGWLLRAQARVAKTGRVTAGLPPLDVAAKIGSIILGVWLFLLPVRFFAGLLSEARYIRGGPEPWGLWIALGGIGTACALGIWFYLRRAGRPDVLATIRGQATLGQDFWMGLRGLVGTAAWLAVPSLTLWLVDVAAQANKPGLGVLLFIVSLVMFGLVLGWLPGLQVHFATENRWGALFEVGHARTLFRRAPIATGVAIFAIVAHAIPLYLLAIAVPPRDALWMVAVGFVVMTFGARTIVAWAHYRGVTRTHEAGRFARLVGRSLALTATSGYVVGIFLARYVAAEGAGVLLRHHGLAIPIPF